MIRQCEAGGEWSGSRMQCNIRHCLDITTLVPNSRSCDTSYTSTCMVECEDGYNRSGDSPQYSCDLNGTDVVWMFTGTGVTCSPVPCASLSDPENGNVTCPSNTSVFQDTCTYYCNRGYQLEGNRQTTCTADGTWSSEPVTCTILRCNDPEVEITNSQSVGLCDVTYGSSCSLNCSSGFSASGYGEHVCDDVNDEGTSVKWRSIGGGFTCAAATVADNESASPVATIGGAVGGVLVLIVLIFVSLGVVCYIRYSQKKKTYDFSNKKMAGLDSDINMASNPSYDNNKQAKKQECQYDYVHCGELSHCSFQEDTIKQNTDPSCEGIQECETLFYDYVNPGCDVTTQLNPSYNTVSSDSKPSRKVSEDQDGYVKTDILSGEGTNCMVHVPMSKIEKSNHKGTDDIDNIKVNPNPSYESVSRGVTLEDNPSYNKVKFT